MFVSETSKAIPDRNQVEWNERTSFKAVFKTKDFGEAYERERKRCVGNSTSLARARSYDPKLFVLSLKGKRARTTFTLGSITIDLSEYVTDAPTSLHLPFQSGSHSLPSETEFRGKIRVVSLNGASEPMDSTTVGDSDDEGSDDPLMAGLPSLETPQQSKFVFAQEELGANRGRITPVNVALSSAKTQDEVKELKRRFATQRREADARHQEELAKLQSQMRSAVVEHEQRVRQMELDAQQRQESTSAGTLLALRGQLDEGAVLCAFRSGVSEDLRVQCRRSLCKRRRRYRPYATSSATRRPKTWSRPWRLRAPRRRCGGWRRR